MFPFKSDSFRRIEGGSDSGFVLNAKSAAVYQWSRGFTRRLLSGRFFDVIMIEHAAVHGLTTNIFRVGRYFRVFVPKRDKVVDSLVGPLPVVMGLNAAQNMTEVPFSQRNNVV